MAISRGSVLAYVINRLTDDKEDIPFESDGADRRTEATARLSFRLCMANVLISACHKISDTGKKSYAKKILPCVIHSIRVCYFLIVVIRFWHGVIRNTDLPFSAVTLSSVFRGWQSLRLGRRASRFSSQWHTI